MSRRSKNRHTAVRLHMILRLANAATISFSVKSGCKSQQAVTVEVYAGPRVMIFVVDLRTGLLRLVSHVRSRSDESAAWSPDSRQIAFISCATDESNCNLGLIDRSGSGRKVIVSNLGRPPRQREPEPREIHPEQEDSHAATHR